MSPLELRYSRPPSQPMELDSAGLPPRRIDRFIDDAYLVLGYDPDAIVAWFAEHVAQRVVRHGWIQDLDGCWRYSHAADVIARRELSPS